MAVVHVADPDKVESLAVVEDHGTVCVYMGNELLERFRMEQWVEFIAGTFDVPTMLDRLGVGRKPPRGYTPLPYEQGDVGD